jgi:L-fucose mutarotase/ribose pyranase (RbsD/FucU family)
MMHRIDTLVVLTVCWLTMAEPCLGQESEPTKPAETTAEWISALAERLPKYGHRNWIVIADSAYPAQTSTGIETIVTHADQLAVVEAVLDQLAQARHIRPVVYLDEELAHVPESDAGGIDAYRRELTNLLGKRATMSLPHEQLLARLYKTGESFQVLVLKTDLALPYTSVFLELDCGYWSPEAEKRLRDAMQSERK